MESMWVHVVHKLLHTIMYIYNLYHGCGVHEREYVHT